MTQHQEIAARLIKGQTLTNLDGLRMRNKTMKLNTRISELRRWGFPIQDEWVETETSKKVKRYFILDKSKAFKLYEKNWLK